MQTVLESLKGINPYPIPYRTLESVSVRYGLSLESEATEGVMNSRAYKLACASLLRWLSTAPNITQGGQSYSFSDEERKELRNQAYGLIAEAEEGSAGKTLYGHKGSRL